MEHEAQCCRIQAAGSKRRFGRRPLSAPRQTFQNRRLAADRTLAQRVLADNPKTIGAITPIREQFPNSLRRYGRTWLSHRDSVPRALIVWLARTVKVVRRN